MSCLKPTLFSRLVRNRISCSTWSWLTSSEAALRFLHDLAVTPFKSIIVFGFSGVVPPLYMCCISSASFLHIWENHGVRGPGAAPSDAGVERWRSATSAATAEVSSGVAGFHSTGAGMDFGIYQVLLPPLHLPRCPVVETQGRTLGSMVFNLRSFLEKWDPWLVAANSIRTGIHISGDDIRLIALLKTELLFRSQCRTSWPTPGLHPCGTYMCLFSQLEDEWPGSMEAS